MTDTTASAPGPTPAPARPRGRRGLLFPLVLIVLGGLFFAANFGYIPPISARAVLSLWPLILVLVGIEMIVARRQPYLALALELVVIAAGVAAVLAQPLGITVSPDATTDARVEREGARSLSLRVEGGGGSYTVAADQPGALVSATSRGGQIEVATRRTSDSADVRIHPLERLGGPFFGSMAPASVDVRIAPDVPTSLRLQVGAGDFNVDLHDVQVRDARIETGASNLTVTLPRPSGDVNVIVQAGAANITLIVPDGVEARITTTGGLLSSTTQNPRFGASSSLGRNTSSAETSGYATAKDRVTLSIEAGASSITIR